ncbi:DUF6367 family protein [Chromobacterium violaceum]|uniref:DUF6367 family protein n=1 Tax=Chromobacterium violaceum TaxID=536 RepID=UPI00111C8203|nr:DUF6367 family protein [Chromobacterium violaceum]
MKLNEIINPEQESYLVVEIPNNLTLPDDITLNEGQWRPSKFNDLWYRVDAADPAMAKQRHIHIAHKKHISAANKQVSWNQDHSRHDAHKFDSSFTGIEKAKDLARQMLGLPPSAILEQKHRSTTEAGLILEALNGLTGLPEEAIILKLRIN